jgi:hypothetical protein
VNTQLGTIRDNIGKIEQDVKVANSVLLQDKIVARAIDTASYTERTTADGVNVVNDSDAFVLIIDGRTVQNLCPIVSPSQIEFAEVELTTVSNGANHTANGQYLQAEITERGIEIKLKDNALPIGHNIGSVKLLSTVGESGTNNLALDSSKNYYFYCNNISGTATCSLTCNIDTTPTSYNQNSVITGVGQTRAIVTLTISSGTILPISQDKPVWVIQPMLVEGTRNIGYAPMGGQPTNSKIKSIKSEGSNLVDISAMLNANLTYEGDGIYKLTKGTSSSSAIFRFPQELEAGDYTFAVDYIDTDITYKYQLQATTRNSATASTSVSSQYGRLPVKAGTTQFQLYLENSNDIPQGSYVRFRNLRLTKGYDSTRKPPYAPYGVNDTLIIDENGLELSEGESYVPSPNSYKAWTYGTETVDTADGVAPTIVTDYLTII